MINPFDRMTDTAGLALAIRDLHKVTHSMETQFGFDSPAYTETHRVLMQAVNSIDGRETPFTKARLRCEITDQILRVAVEGTVEIEDGEPMVTVHWVREDQIKTPWLCPLADLTRGWCEHCGDTGLSPENPHVGCGPCKAYHSRIQA